MAVDWRLDLVECGSAEAAAAPRSLTAGAGMSSSTVAAPCDFARKID